jgi:tetratricopeptide (TPR) repeat protein
MSHTNSVSYIYNPLNQTEVELRKNFVVRDKEFRTIFDDIKTASMKHPEPHYIIQGQRGQGKTTLLLKLYYEVKREEKLIKKIVPVIFNEEQYHISSLFGLWSHAAEKLEEEHEAFIGAYDTIESLYEASDFEVEAFKYLEGCLKKEKKKLILFIDNVGHLFDKLDKKEQQRLREVLITCPEIRLIGASSEVLEHTYDYSKPFYQLFRIINLHGLKKEEAITLLLKLGEHYKQDNIKEIVSNDPGRIESLRRLTSGVPRTLVLLFEIFVDNREGSAFMDLEIVLDRVTPLYKHRMDDLPTQQQKIVDAIALEWDAIAAKDIAVKTHLTSKTVSSQLKLLEKKRIIKKIPTTTKNHFYQVDERFFNIWYLMRYGRQRGKNRVQWLVRFLECWCSEIELENRVKQHLDAMRSGGMHVKHAYYFTEALAKTKLPMGLQHGLIIQTRDFLQDKDQYLLQELSQSDLDLYTNAVDYFLKGEFDEALKSLKPIQNKNGEVLSLIALTYLKGFNDFKKAEEFYLRALESGHPHAKFHLSHLYFIQHKNKELALELVKTNDSERESKNTLLTTSLILLWNNKLEDSLNITEITFNKKPLIKIGLNSVKNYFMLLIAKKQYYTALKLFNNSPLDLKEKLTPLYYALFHFLKDDFPNETKKMGPELEETVTEIIKKVHQWEKDYA